MMIHRCDPLQTIEIIPASFVVWFVSMCLHGMHHISCCKLWLEKYQVPAKFAVCCQQILILVACDQR